MSNNSSEDEPPTTSNNNTNNNDSGLIRCICGFEHDDGFTIQCEQCLVWQHAVCVEIDYENVPDSYLCEKCFPRSLNIEQAKHIQRKNSEGNSPLKSSSLTDNLKKQKPKLKGRKNSFNPKRKHLVYRKNSKPENIRTNQLVKFVPTDENILSKCVKEFIHDLLMKNNENLVETLLNENNIIKFEPEKDVTLPTVSVKKVNSENNTRIAAASTTAASQINNGLFSKNLIKNMQFIGEFKGRILTRREYCDNLENYYNYIGIPLPFVFFCNGEIFTIDCQTIGNNFRFIRNSCENNAIIAPFCNNKKEIHFGLFAQEEILVDEEITIPWEIEESFISNSLLFNKEIKNTNFQNIVKDKIQDKIEIFTNEHITHEQAFSRLSEIDNAIKLLRKCACDRGISCKYNRVIKTTKKLWNEKLMVLIKNSVSNSPNSMVEFNEETHTMNTRNNSNTNTKLYVSTPIKLFDETTKRELKLSINSLMKRGLRKFITHKYKKYCVKNKYKIKSNRQSPASSKKEIKPTNELNPLSPEKNISKIQALVSAKNLESPSNNTQITIKKTIKAEKMELLKKLNETNKITTEGLSLKKTNPSNLDKSKSKTVAQVENMQIPTTEENKPNIKSRPKSRSISVYKEDNHLKKKITLQEYLAQINAADPKKDLHNELFEQKTNNPIVPGIKNKKENPTLKNKKILPSETITKSTNITPFSIKPVSVMPYVEEIHENNSIEKTKNGLLQNNKKTNGPSLVSSSLENSESIISTTYNNNSFKLKSPEKPEQTRAHIPDIKTDTTKSNTIEQIGSYKQNTKVQPEIENIDPNEKSDKNIAHSTDILNKEQKVRSPVQASIITNISENKKTDEKVVKNDTIFTVNTKENSKKLNRKKEDNYINPNTLDDKDKARKDNNSDSTIIKNEKAFSDVDTKEKPIMKDEQEKKNNNVYQNITHHYKDRDCDKYSERSNESYNRSEHKYKNSSSASYNKWDMENYKDRKYSNSYYDEHYHNYHRDDYYMKKLSGGSAGNPTSNNYHKSSSNKYNDYYSHTTGNNGYYHHPKKSEESGSSSRYYDERSRSHNHHYYSSSGDRTYEKDYKYSQRVPPAPSERRESKYGYLTQPNRGETGALSSEQNKNGYYGPQTEHNNNNSYYHKNRAYKGASSPSSQQPKHREKTYQTTNYNENSKEYMDLLAKNKNFREE